jgi:phosphoribosylamine--glycine ligase
MNIALFGESAGTYSLSQHLLKLKNVSRVFHYGASPKVYSSSNYHPLFTLEPDVKKFVLDLPSKHHFDLIFPLGINYQVWEEFRKTMLGKKIPMILPDPEITKLEWSKIKGKEFLLEAGVPTTEYSVYKKTELLKNFYNITRPFVLKYDRDWRAGMQTVIVTDENVIEEFNTVKNSTRYYMKEEDQSRQQFLIEKFITIKKEFSYHAICNNKGWRYLGSARDYKKRYETDIGFNTSGMGAYSPVEIFDQVVHTYADKIFNLMRLKGYDTRFILYLGIAITDDNDPIVLEINARPGDPEFQTIYPLIENDLADLLYKAGADEDLPEVMFTDKTALSLRIVHKDYKLENDKTNDFPQLWPIPGNVSIAITEPPFLLHSVVTTVDDNLELARETVYNFLKNKRMGSYTYRTDIGVTP